MILDRLLRGPGDALQTREAALARLRAFLPPSFEPPSSGAAAPEIASAGAPGPVAAGSLRLDPGRRGLVALVVVGLLAAAVAGLVYLRSRPVAVPVAGRVAAGTPLVSPSPSAAATLVVDVAGHVRRPGVVSLPAGSRVTDAVQAAGGVSPGTDVGLLNLARKLVDGEQVLVGVTPPPGAGAGGGAAGTAGPVNLNTATEQDLESLPGVGPVLAQRIVEWRDAHGGFRNVEQLKDVGGIGPSKYADLHTRVTV